MHSHRAERNAENENKRNGSFDRARSKVDLDFAWLELVIHTCFYVLSIINLHLLPSL